MDSQTKEKVAELILKIKLELDWRWKHILSIGYKPNGLFSISVFNLIVNFCAVRTGVGSR